MRVAAQTEATPQHALCARLTHSWRPRLRGTNTRQRVGSALAFDSRLSWCILCGYVLPREPPLLLAKLRGDGLGFFRRIFIVFRQFLAMLRDAGVAARSLRRRTALIVRRKFAMVRGFLEQLSCFALVFGGNFRVLFHDFCGKAHRACSEQSDCRKADQGADSTRHISSP